MFFPHTPPPLRGHPLPPLSALATAHIWANPGHTQRPRAGSNAHTHHHHPSTCHIITSNSSKHDTRQPQVGRAKGHWRGGVEGGKRLWGGVMTTRRHETHMLPCPIHPLLFSLLSFVTTRCATYMPRRLFISFTINWRRGVQPTRRVIYLFLSLSIDDAACRLHAASSTSLFYYQLMTWHASYMLHRWFLSFTINWRCGVQSTCRVVNFSLSLSIDDAACILHAALSISFFHYHLSGSSRLNTSIVYIVCQ